VVVLVISACGTDVRRIVDAASPGSSARDRLIARAQVWLPAAIERQDLKSGPRGPGAFPFLATVECQYDDDEEFGGRSPKFGCVTARDDTLKVKYGGGNAEVYGEVAATRLLWALGFGADRMYPVRVICRECPMWLGGIARLDGDSFIFDPATIERQIAGRDIAGDDGWAWPELDKIDPRAGGAPRAHVDALKLLAVFIQHTDSKPENQRLICRDSGAEDDGRCDRPFMLIQDLGLTFGAANALNDNARAVSLVDWKAQPIWTDDRCVGNLSRSVTGTLGNPVISEAGRAFLAGLLARLSDRQIQHLFEAARVHLRLRNPGDVQSGYSTVAEWVAAFKEKRRQIVQRRC
jgi:hypothetical protein